MEGTDT